MNIVRLICSLFALLALTEAVGNPGILISVPFPLSPPAIALSLPLPVDNILISNLQLNNVLLTTVDYKWKLNLAYAEVNVSLAQLEFDWFYKHDKGRGTFTQTNLRVQIHYSFISSKTNHFEINVTSMKIVPGHSKVVLGSAGIPEIVIVQVTNLILNHASLLFRGIISKKLSQVITGLASGIGDDKMIYADKLSGKQFYLNTSLVASPITSGQNIIIQINAAPYIKGTLSGSLNPSDVLVRVNSTKIQVQIHKQLVSRIISLILQARGGALDVVIHTTDITSVIQINSLLLCTVFPKMVQFQDQRDVFFNVKIPTVDFSFKENNLKFDLKMSSNVVTHNSIDRKDQLYINRIDGAISIEIQAIFGAIKNSIRMVSVKVLQFSPSKSDIQGGLIVPQALMNYIDILLGWLTDAFNLQLNRFVKDFTFKNIQVSLKGSGIKNVAYLIEIDLLQL